MRVMRRTGALSVIALLAACAEGTVVQPEVAGPPEPALAAAYSQIPNVPGGMEFTAIITHVSVIDPGVTHVTPSGVIHVSGIVNEWAMTGDLSGPFYFIGGYQIDPKTGMGRSVGKPVVFEIQASRWGMVGSFTCNGAFRIENFPAITQYGTAAGCHGTGDFEGMLLKAYISNEANPGGIAYDAYGVIW